MMKKNRLAKNNIEKPSLCFTEAGGGNSPARDEIKGKFMGQEQIQTQNYIKDLEKNLFINKQIITELLSQEKSQGQIKKVIDKLNSENANLQDQLKKAIKERNEYQGKLLITEQIVENNKTKEQEICKEYDEKILNLVDQLNRKEYSIQCMESKYNRIKILLNKFSHKDPELKKNIKELRLELPENSKIVNVVEENAALIQELNEEKKKVQELNQQLANARDGNKKLEIQIQALIQEQKPSKNGNVINIPKLKLPSEDYVEQTKRMQREIGNLYKLNVQLSEALEQAKEKLDLFQKQKAQPNKKQNKSSINCFQSNAPTSSRVATTKSSTKSNLPEEKTNNLTKSARLPTKQTDNGTKNKEENKNHFHVAERREQNKFSFGEIHIETDNIDELSSIHDDDLNGSFKQGKDNNTDELKGDKIIDYSKK